MRAPTSSDPTAELRRARRPAFASARLLSPW